MARHVGADTHIQFWRWSKPEVRVETDDGVNLAYRYFQALGHPVELLDGKISKLPVYGSELIEPRDPPQACFNRQGVATGSGVHRGSNLGSAVPIVKLMPRDYTAPGNGCRERNAVRNAGNPCFANHHQPQTFSLSCAE